MTIRERAIEEVKGTIGWVLSAGTAVIGVDSAVDIMERALRAEDRAAKMEVLLKKARPHYDAIDPYTNGESWCKAVDDLLKEGN